MPAVVASQKDPIISVFYQNLIDQGKERMQALVAIMRQLLHGMLKSKTDFDPRLLFPHVQVENA